MHDLWTEALGVQRIGMHMNFFSAGGTSLLAGMVALKLNEAFGCSESATLLFNHPTIEGVAAKMEGLPTGTITKQVGGPSWNVAMILALAGLCMRCLSPLRSYLLL